MKFIVTSTIITLLFFSAKSCKGQSFFDTNQNIAELYESGNYTRLADKLYEIRSKEKNKMFTSEIDLLRGKCFLNLRDHRSLKKSKMIFKRLIKAKKKINYEIYTQSLKYYAQSLHKLTEVDSALVYYKKYNNLIAEELILKAIESCHFALNSYQKNTSHTVSSTSFNTKLNDFTVTPLNKNELIITSEGYSSKNQSDFYHLIFNQNTNRWIFSDRYTKSINSSKDEKSPHFNIKDSTLYFSRNTYESDNLTSYKIYTFDLSGKSKKEKLLINIPHNNSSFLCPLLSNDGNTLFFCSDMKGGYGGYDIWMIKKIADAKWSDPINLGKKVNTSMDELYPFLSSNDKLFFSSNGHLGMGGQDIFVAEINSYFKILSIRNLGYPINSTNDDFGFVLLNNKVGFFTSNRLGSNLLDIYKVENNENGLLQLTD